MHTVLEAHTHPSHSLRGACLRGLEGLEADPIGPQQLPRHVQQTV